MSDINMLELTCISCGENTEINDINEITQQNVSEKTECKKCHSNIFDMRDPYQIYDRVKKFKDKEDVQSVITLNERDPELSETRYITVNKAQSSGKGNVVLGFTLIIFGLFGWVSSASSNSFIGFLVSTGIVLVGGAILGNHTKQKEAKQIQNENKTCPKCAETIKIAALVCRYCNHQFAETETSQTK
jgi:hypothetical protein